MVKFKKIFYFLLFNAVISAATTLLVLWYWDARKPASQVPAVTALTVVVAIPPSGGSVDLATPGVVETLVIAQQTATLTPGPLEIQYYQVQTGDTLSKIAVLFKANMEDIMRLNEIEDPNNLYVGQVLKIPGSPLPTFTPQASPTGLLSSTPTSPPPTPTPTRTRDLSPGSLAIENVFGAGVLQLERVKIAHTSGGTISLEGWQLVESGGQVFTFPKLELFAGGVVYVNTRSGTNSPLDLFWGLETAVWEVGERVILRDEQGVQRAAFVIP